MVMHQLCHSIPWCTTTQSHSGHLFGCVLTWSTSNDAPSYSATPQQGTTSTRCSTQQTQQSCHTYHTWGCWAPVPSSCVSVELNGKAVSMWCAPFTLTVMIGDVNHWVIDNHGVISDTLAHDVHLVLVFFESHSLHHSILCSHSFQTHLWCFSSISNSSLCVSKQSNTFSVVHFGAVQA